MPEKLKFATQKIELERKPISDAEVGGLLAAIGNHEGKALLLLAMQAEQPYTRTQLRGVLKEQQGPKDRWKGMNESLPFLWCQHSLSPIGLVVKEIVDPERGTVGYMKKEKGDELGQALAGHLLAFSEEHPEVSLNGFFGSTQMSPKRKVVEDQQEKDERSRAPLTRARIFAELVTTAVPIREADFARDFVEGYPAEYQDRSSSLRAHLKNLSNSNVISVEKDTTRRSTIDLSTAQREALVELVTIIDKFKENDPDFMREGKVKAQAIVSDSQRFGKLLEKARNASSSRIEPTDVTDASAKLKSLIGGGRQSTSDLQRGYSEQYGKNLSDQTIRSVLRGMRKAGGIQVVRDGSINYYSLPEDVSSEAVTHSLPQSITIFEAN